MGTAANTEQSLKHGGQQLDHDSDAASTCYSAGADLDRWHLDVGKIKVVNIEPLLQLKISEVQSLEAR
jgi:hypothetical protein